MIKKFFKVFFSFTIIFTLIFTGAIFYNDVFKKDNGASAQEEEEKPKAEGDSISFLLMGVDSKDISEKSQVRTDTLMVFNVTKDGEISILSVPRDTKTPIKGRKYEEKINHAHAYGGKELTLDTVSDLLGIDLEYYVIADYKFVREFVDLIGGVEIDVPMDMHYEDPTDDPPLYIDLKQGLQKLDGEKSLQYLRFRKGYKNADLGRIGAQQEFIKAMVKASLRPATILKIPKIYSAYNDYINTNIPFSTIAGYGMKFYKFETDNISMTTLPGEPKTIKGVSYFVHYKEDTKELVRGMFY